MRRRNIGIAVAVVIVVLGTDGQDQPGVFVPDGRTVRFQPVKTGLIGGLDIEVTGLNDGVSVVTGPFQALRELNDGQAVRVQVPR